MFNYPYLIPIFPLMAFVLLITMGKRLGKVSAYISVFASSLAAVFSIFAFINHLNGVPLRFDFTWIMLRNAPFKFGVIVDPLSITMLLVVTIIGTLIQVYSMGYMHGDKRYSRFFAYMSLFTFSMLGLVLSNNFIMLYIFWELVGACSYLLISFWFERDAAANAGKKAFLTTRLGDVGLFIGLAMIYWITGSVYFSDLPIAALKEHHNHLTVAAILIFCGAVGKSAQFPLHVWLPDAMEGPTPVSALIHAATMVAAGVYLVARCYSLFFTHHAALMVVAYIGVFTAFMAATIALVANDIKRILAYSTISQLGFMMTALGIGGYSAGCFHLMTHAFFKALLFLGAGSVIHGIQSQDIREMGGLFSKMKVTAVTFIIGALAISGVPPFSGFWSKDSILTEVFLSGHYVVFALAYLSCIFTAFYMFRLCFVVFFGKSRSENHAHESPAVMTVPLIILSLFAVFVGLIGSPVMHNWFGHFVKFGESKHIMHHGVMISSVIAAALGIGIAFILYIMKIKIIPDVVRKRFSFLYKLLLNKYYVDEIYYFAFIRPFVRISRQLFRFDKNVIEGTVKGVGVISIFLSEMQYVFERYCVNGLVNAVGWVVRMSGAHARRLQTGLVQNYMFAVVFGIVILLFIKLLK